MSFRPTREPMPSASGRADATKSSVLLDRLLRLHPRRIDLSLDRIHRLLTALNNPHTVLPPVIHVAGTNGKGSVIAFLNAILAAHGLRCHVYTSPHLIRFHERIVLAGIPIDETTLAATLATCEAANEDQPITAFEITTAAALLAFANQPADAVLLETGLGGRLDATNVLTRPALTVITPVDLDHQDYLGDTLAAIAGEKAGILKAGVTAVVARQAPEAARVIRTQALALDAQIRMGGDAWRISVDSDASSFRYTSERLDLKALAPTLSGMFQYQNAGTAIAAAEAFLGERIDSTAIRRGVEMATWPGRLQHLKRGRLVDRLPHGWELWLDGGHNPAAARELAAFLAVKCRDRPVHLIWGMMAGKDAAGFLSALREHISRCVTVPTPGTESGSPPAALATLARAAGVDCYEADCVSTALTKLRNVFEASAPAPRVLVAGSLYLAGAVLKQNGPDEY